jgi:hypothetical protein
MGEVLGAARRAVRSMLEQVGCAWLMEEAATGGGREAARCRIVTMVIDGDRIL